MKRGSLYGFNPRNTGLYEARLWKAYYDRRWPTALLLLFRLLRSQFSLDALSAARAAFWGILAAVAWAPRTNDRARVQRFLTRFYAVLRDATNAPFDPSAAGAAEFNYWVVHRELDGQTGRPELADALTRIAVVVYNLPAAGVHAAGVARAEACDLVDAITAGQQLSTRSAWSAIEEALRRAYTILRDEAGEVHQVSA